MSSTDTATEFTFSYPASGRCELHARGCKAAARKGAYTSDTTMTVAEIAEMLDNPDEGEIHVHACARSAFPTR